MSGKYNLIKDLSELNKALSQGNAYLDVNQSVFGIDCESEKVTKAFVSGFNTFYCKISEDFDLFCEFFGLDPTESSDLDKFYQFKQLAKIINKFSLQELVTMIDSGRRHRIRRNCEIWDLEDTT